MFVNYGGWLTKAITIMTLADTFLNLDKGH